MFPVEAGSRSFLLSYISGGSLRYLMCAGRKRRGNGGVLRTVVACPLRLGRSQSLPAPSLSLDLTLRSPTEKPEKTLNILQLLSDAETRLLVRCENQVEVIISSLQNTSHYQREPSRKQGLKSVRKKEMFSRVTEYMENQICLQEKKISNSALDSI